MMEQPNIVVIDNYDSFTYNLVHLLEQLELPLHIMRNDRIDWGRLESASHVLLGPGPGIPEEAGALMEVVHRFKTDKSILGVCLGMQALLQEEKVSMLNMPTVQHGMQDEIQLVSDAQLFAGLGKKLRVGRYHSWAFPSNIDQGNYRITATGSDDYVMAVEHRTLSLYGVQFHPESIMTERGLDIIRNWVDI
jgi:anthranilate synthase component 2